MKQYAPFSEQPKVDRTRDELNEAEQAIYDFFINKQSVEKLISYLALEEQKGRDKFRSKYLILFKVCLLGGGGGAELFLCPYPPKVQACPPRDQRPASQSIVSGWCVC